MKANARKSPRQDSSSEHFEFVLWALWDAGFDYLEAEEAVTLAETIVGLIEAPSAELRLVQ